MTTAPTLQETTTTELLAEDARIGNELDKLGDYLSLSASGNPQFKAPAWLLLQKRKAVRAELTRRHSAE